MVFSRDPRRLPRIAVGSRSEPNRFLVVAAHDPMFNNVRGAPRITYPGRKVMGQAWLESRGPWLAILQRALDMGAGPYYDVLRLVPVSSEWGQRPLDLLRFAAGMEAQSIMRIWNESGLKPDADNRFDTTDFTGRLQP